MSNFYAELNRATEAERQELLSIPFIQQGARGELSLESYIAFLTQAYHHVKHTTPLLMACGSKVPSSAEWMRDAIAHYIEEELGHQEWILNDIKVCGGDGEAVRNSEPGMAADSQQPRRRSCDAAHGSGHHGGADPEHDLHPQ